MNAYLRIKADGTRVEMIPFGGPDGSLYDHIRNEIGADIAEPVRLGRHPSGLEIVMLVDEDGYSKYMEDPSKVNRIATAIYNMPEDYDRPHFILGDVALCGETEDGFCPFTDATADAIMERLEKGGVLEAAKSIKEPERIPEPKFTIETYDSADELIDAMKARREGRK